MVNPVEFGKYLKELRECRKLTTRQVENFCGVSNSYLSLIENGKRGIPSPDILNKLAPVYRIQYEDLMVAAGYLTTGIDQSLTKAQINNTQIETIRPFMQPTGDISRGTESPLSPEIDRLIDTVKNLSPEQIEALNQFIKTMATPEHTTDHEKDNDSCYVPLAAHRDDNITDDLPDDAALNIEEFKRYHIQEVEKERKKK